MDDIGLNCLVALFSARSFRSGLSPLAPVVDHPDTPTLSRSECNHGRPTNSLSLSLSLCA